MGLVSAKMTSTGSRGRGSLGAEEEPDAETPVTSHSSGSARGRGTEALAWWLGRHHRGGGLSWANGWQESSTANLGRLWKFPSL